MSDIFQVHVSEVLGDGGARYEVRAEPWSNWSTMTWSPPGFSRVRRDLYLRPMTSVAKFACFRERGGQVGAQSEGERERCGARGGAGAVRSEGGSGSGAERGGSGSGAERGGAGAERSEGGSGSGAERGGAERSGARGGAGAERASRLACWRAGARERSRRRGWGPSADADGPWQRCRDGPWNRVGERVRSRHRPLARPSRTCEKRRRSDRRSGNHGIGHGAWVVSMRNC